MICQILQHILSFLKQLHLLACLAVGIGVGVGVTLFVIFTVGTVLFVLNKKKKKVCTAHHMDNLAR